MIVGVSRAITQILAPNQRYFVADPRVIEERSISRESVMMAGVSLNVGRSDSASPVGSKRRQETWRGFSRGAVLRMKLVDFL